MVNNDRLSQRTRLPLAIIVLGMAIPTIGTYFYFDLLSGSDPLWQKCAYVGAKGAQLLILVLALALWRRKPNDETLPVERERPSATNGIWVGLGTGLAIGVLMLVMFQLVLKPANVMEPVKLAAQEKLRGLGADSPSVLLAIAAFYAIIHSGFEELYWRGFVFRGLLQYTSSTSSVVLSSFGFMSHHIIVLAKYFGYGSVWTYLFSLGVAVGGVVWAVLYKRYEGLWPGWLSHAIVDAAIFFIGFLLLFS